MVVVSNTSFDRLNKRAANFRGYFNSVNFTSVEVKNTGWNEDPTNVMGQPGWGIGIQIGATNGTAIFHNVSVTESLQSAIKVYGRGIDVRMSSVVLQKNGNHGFMMLASATTVNLTSVLFHYNRGRGLHRCFFDPG